MVNTRNTRLRRRRPSNRSGYTNSHTTPTSAMTSLNSIEYFDYPVENENDSGQEQEQEQEQEMIRTLPNGIGQHLPVVQNITSFVIRHGDCDDDDEDGINGNGRNHCSGLICLDEGGEEEEKTSEEDENECTMGTISTRSLNTSSEIRRSDLRVSAIIGEVDYMPLFEDEQVPDDKLYYLVIGTTRQAVRDPDDLKLRHRQKRVKIEERDDEEQERLRAQERELRSRLGHTFQESNSLNIRGRTVGGSFVSGRTLAQVEAAAALDAERDFYANLTNVAYLRAETLIRDGAVTNTIVEKIPKKFRNGKYLLRERLLKNRLFSILFMSVGAALLALYFAGTLGGISEDDPVQKGIINQDDSYLWSTHAPSSAPSYAPSGSSIQLLSAVSITQILSRGNNSDLLTYEEVDQFETAMKETLNPAVLTDDNVASRVQARVQMIEQHVLPTFSEQAQMSLGVNATKSRLLEEREDDELYTLFFNYNISWSSTYPYWNEFNNSSTVIENVLMNFTRNGQMDEMFNSLGIMISNTTDTMILSVIQIPLPSESPSYMPTFGKLVVQQNIYIFVHINIYLLLSFRAYT